MARKINMMMLIKDCLSTVNFENPLTEDIAWLVKSKVQYDFEWKRQ